MRKIIAVVFLLIISITGYAQKLDGTWKGKTAGQNGEMELIFTFKVDANTLSGSVKSEMGTLPLENGKANGNEFSFDININGQTMSNTGVLNGDVVKISAPMMPEPMVLSRVKEESKKGEAKIDGKWLGKVTSPQGDFELTFTFKVDGTKLTGKNSSSMGDMEISNGVVNGNEFSFDIDMQGMKIAHKCKYLDNDSIEIKSEVMDQVMTINLTRAAQ